MPPSVANRADECIAFNAAGGFRALEWQESLVRSWLGVNEFGRWSARTCGNSIPRQNGKTLGVTESRMNWGACALNELVLYTSHLQKTSTETFEDMAAFFDQKKFRKYLKAIRTALGRESIEFKAGGRIKFLARTRNGGRGQHCDLLVFDEAQELTDEQQASFTPCLSASSNPQTIYTGTPPDENAPGTVFRRIRERGLAGEPNRAWAEWSVDEIGDVRDRDRWYASNPSLGLLILEETVETESIDFAPDKFARERLGWWAPREKLVDHVIDAGAWAMCETDDPPIDGVACVGVKFGTDRTTVSFAIMPKDSAPYVEWADTRPLSDGVGWAAQWIRYRRSKIASVAVDGRSGTGALTTKLADMGFPAKALVIPSSADVAKANAMLLSAVNEGELQHYGQIELNDSATLTARRRIGNDGFGFEDHNGADSTLIESCALALWQAKTTKRRPGRKAVVL